MIVSRFPYPLEKGDKLRAFYQLKELKANYDVTLVALHDQALSEEQLSKVNEICAEVITVRLGLPRRIFQLLRCLVDGRPFQSGYFYSWKAQRIINNLIKVTEYDQIYCQLIRTTEYVLNEHRIPKTLDYMDALSAGIKRRINRQPFYKRWLFRSEARRLTRYERVVFDYFEHLTIISEQDQRLISHPERKKIVCIPNGISQHFFEPIQQVKTHDFVFVGNMSYPPNIDAVHYIAEKILPAFPGATLLVSGSSPHSSLQTLAAKNAKITLTGWVEDIRTSYASGKIFLAPMMIGTGMQNKLLEAMAMGIPCVTTPLANNAIGAESGSEIMVGKSEKEIIAAIDHLRKNETLATEIGNAGRKFIQENYSWHKSTTILQQLFDKDNRKEPTAK